MIRWAYVQKKEWELPKIATSPVTKWYSVSRGRRKIKWFPWLQISPCRKSYSPTLRPCYWKSTTCHCLALKEEKKFNIVVIFSQGVLYSSCKLFWRILQQQTSPPLLLFYMEVRSLFLETGNQKMRCWVVLLLAPKPTLRSWHPWQSSLGLNTFIIRSSCSSLQKYWEGFAISEWDQDCQASTWNSPLWGPPAGLSHMDTASRQIAIF